jgi:hypothetical protein
VLSDYKETFNLRLNDTTNKILKISYQNSDKVFYPNDTISELLVSNNKITTVFIQTQNDIDTLSLSPKIEYYYYEGTCSKGIEKRYLGYNIEQTFSKFKQYFERSSPLSYTITYNYEFYITP